MVCVSKTGINIFGATAKGAFIYRNGDGVPWVDEFINTTYLRS